MQKIVPSFFFVIIVMSKQSNLITELKKKGEQEDNVKKTSKVNIGFSFKNRALNTAYTTNAA